MNGTAGRGARAAAALGRVVALVAAIAPWQGTAAMAAVAAPPGQRQAPGQRQDSGPRQAIVHADAERAGATRTWELPADAPYLYVPFLGAKLGGEAAAIDVGTQIGAVLFQRPLFASADKGCQPDIGTNARADLKWLGATARIVPPPPGQPAAEAAAPFGSFILYRRDLGPPPGVLLLDRRRTIGLRCANPSHQILYSRLFVPVAEMPAPSRCVDLAKTYQPDGAREQTLRFTMSDRAILLMPEDADNAYGRVRHDVGVVLYDGLGCTGTALAIKGAASQTRDVRLGKFNFRDRARSLKLVYNAGALDPFMTRPPAPEPAPMTEAPRPATPPKPPVEIATAPMSDPAVALEPPPEDNGEPAHEASATPSPKAVTKVAAKAAPQPKVAAKAAPQPKVAAKAAPQPKVAAKAAPAIGQRAALPKLRPVLPPLPGRNPPPGGASETFEYPVHQVYRLNYCLFSGSQCGEPAAVAWCKTRGFSRATAWKIDENIGGIFPTVVLAEKRVCAKSGCDGFREITCAK